MKKLLVLLAFVFPFLAVAQSNPADLEKQIRKRLGKQFTERNFKTADSTKLANTQIVTAAEKAFWNTKIAGETFKGGWDPATNTPPLSATASAAGDVYRITSTGSTTVLTGSSSVTYVAGNDIKSNGSNWVYVPVNYSLADQTVTPPKATFLGLGKNLYNKGDLDTESGNKAGYYVLYTDGSLVANATYTASPYIPVTPGQVYSPSEKQQLAFYNSSKVYVSGLNSTRTDVKFTAPAGVSYVRLTIQNTNSFQLEAGENRTQPEPYSYQLSGVVVKRENLATAAVGNEIVADGSIAPEKLVFTHRGKNLFNKAAAKTGFYLNTEGYETASATHCISDYIPVTFGKTYIQSGGNPTAGLRFITYYGSNKQVLAGGTENTNTFTVPAGVAYVRLTIYLADINVTQIEEATTVTAFDKYRNIFQDVDVPGALLIDNSITASKIARQAVGPGQTTFIVFDKNLFNISDTINVVGSYLESDGNIYTNANYRITHYIPVTPGTWYYPSQKNRVAFYRADKTYLSGLTHTRTNQQLQAPENAAYVRLSVNAATLSDWTSFQLEVGQTGTAWTRFRRIGSGFELDPPTGSIGTPQLANNAIDATKLATGSVTTAKLAYKAVTLDKLSIATASKNGFNKATVTLNYYLNETNGAFANSTYSYSQLIPVQPGHTYTGWDGTNMMRFVTYFDSLGAYKTGGHPNAVKTFTVPASVYGVKITVWNSGINNFQFEESATNTAPEPYGSYLSNILIPENLVVKAPVSVSATVTEPAIAPKYYIIKQKELAIFSENLHRYYDLEGKGRTDIALTAGVVNATAELKITGRGIKYKQATGNSTLPAITGVLKTYTKDYELAHTKTFTVTTTDPTVSTAKTVQLLGDSYTRRSTFANSYLAGGTGITFVGSIKAASASADIRCEGRGGWAITGAAGYLTANTTLFNPYMQPQDPYKYYGNTSHWISAHVGDNYDTQQAAPEIKTLYNATTGLLISPVTNDVMYVNAESAYKRWNGTAWEVVTGLTFTFNVTKYRSLFSCPIINILHCLLGTNDYASASPSEFVAKYATFKAGYDQIIAAYKADNPSIKIMIGIPVSSGKQGEDGTWETERRKVLYWLLAKAMIADYAGRESEGIYLIDYHSTVDRVYSYDVTDVKPFDNYTGTARERYLSDYIHTGLTGGFIQMADQFFGSLQYVRGQ